MDTPSNFPLCDSLPEHERGGKLAQAVELCKNLTLQADAPESRITKHCPTAALLWLRLAGGFVRCPDPSHGHRQSRCETSPSLRTFANIRSSCHFPARVRARLRARLAANFGNFRAAS